MSGGGAPGSEVYGCTHTKNSPSCAYLQVALVDLVIKFSCTVSKNGRSLEPCILFLFQSPYMDSDTIGALC